MVRFRVESAAGVRKVRRGGKGRPRRARPQPPLEPPAGTVEPGRPPAVASTAPPRQPPYAPRVAGGASGAGGQHQLRFPGAARTTPGGGVAARAPHPPLAVAATPEAAGALVTNNQAQPPVLPGVLPGSSRGGHAATPRIAASRPPVASTDPRPTSRSPRGTNEAARVRPGVAGAVQRPRTRGPLLRPLLVRGHSVTTQFDRRRRCRRSKEQRPRERGHPPKLGQCRPRDGRGRRGCSLRQRLVTHLGYESHPLWPRQFECLEC